MTTIARPMLAWPAKGTFGPFLRFVAPSAVLAALLVKFSSIVAPSLGIQVSSWGLALAYLYFMLCRATYVCAYVAARAPHDAHGTANEAERAFASALGRYRNRSFRICAVLLVLCAAADIALHGLETQRSEAIDGPVVFTAILVWVVVTPGLLLSWAGWARDDAMSLKRAFALIARNPGRALLPWIALVLALAVVSFGALQLVYPLLRDMVVHAIPSGKAAFLFGVAFLACLITGQVWSQAVFATWMRRDVEAIAPAPARQPGDTLPLTTAQQRLSRLGITSGRTTVRRGSTTDVATVEWGIRFVGLLVLLCSGWILSVILATATIDARIVDSRPMCTVARHSPTATGRRRDHGDAMPCRDTAAFLAARPDRGDATVGEAIELTLTYRTASGTEATFRQVVPKDAALPLIGAGHTPIAYRADRKAPGVIESGSRAAVLGANLFLAFAGLLLILAPTFTRKIRRWGARLRGDPPPAPVGRAHPRKVATTIGLMIAVAATLVAFPALVPYAKLIFVVCAIVLAVARRRRAG